ncbi:MAG: hypothetical protein ABIG37_02865 [Nanoarchaeota archaeon]
MAEKKKFFEIELPIIKDKIALYSTSKEKLNKRKIKIDITRKLRGKSIELIFRVLVEKENIKAVPYRMHLFSYFIRRMMRKSISYVEDSFSAECKDAVLKIKPFIISRKKVSRKVKSALREEAKKQIKEKIKNQKYEDLLAELLSGNFQKELGLKLKKIYPLSLCEIRDIFKEKDLAESQEKETEKKVKVKKEISEKEEDTSK